MANAVKGEVAVACGDRTFTIVLTTNALCEAEDLLGQSTGKSVRMLNDLDIRVVRGMFWASLRKHHPDINLQAAADLLDSIGAQAALTALITAVNRAMRPLGDDRPLDAAETQMSPGIGSAPSMPGSPAA